MCFLLSAIVGSLVLLAAFVRKFYDQCCAWDPDADRDNSTLLHTLFLWAALTTFKSSLVADPLFSVSASQSPFALDARTF